MNQEQLGRNLLLVDGNADTRELMTLILYAHGYHVCVAEDGAEALKLLSSQAFQIVLTDMPLSAMSGFELLHCIRSQPELVHLRLLLMTAEQNETPAVQAVADGFLKKPFQIDKLLAMLSPTVH